MKISKSENKTKILLKGFRNVVKKIRHSYYKTQVVYYFLIDPSYFVVFLVFTVIKRFHKVIKKRKNSSITGEYVFIIA
ncbi:hypothetical protein Bcell_3372 [Evansella cellulosilytica DSM 2522]|uniref:Uncharacterized protein n=1 Tax=Evansella cellulosilytica (strain ATCC 21833 / DSM 2522 / FERM P-1141 / JCM 9156 / N-4) TaxID=649639 RepID=E6U1W7_EVAC2|nr:hypothetical protein Bcell_3372 [Evansella cellulosilytica DSM 2522]